MSTTIIFTVREASPVANFKAPSLYFAQSNNLLYFRRYYGGYGWLVNGSDEQILESLLCKPFGKQPRR